ncbi:hypothetical protein ACPXB5_11455 [Micromonospora arida]
MDARNPDLAAAKGEYDWQDFDTRDAIDNANEDNLRAVVFGLPARPGTRR